MESGPTKSYSTLFSAKNMYHLIEKCSIVFKDMLENEFLSKVLEIRHISARYTIDCICCCAFGVESNTMAPNASNPFALMAEELFDTTNSFF